MRVRETPVGAPYLASVKSFPLEKMHTATVSNGNKPDKEKGGVEELRTK